MFVELFENLLESDDICLCVLWLSKVDHLMSLTKEILQCPGNPQ
jgi:hypothetical protein